MSVFSHTLQTQTHTVNTFWQHVV